jgi:hypothetical protein
VIMSEWTSIKEKLPELDVLVRCKGEDFRGDYTILLKRVAYKIRPKGSKTTWRWMRFTPKIPPGKGYWYMGEGSWDRYQNPGEITHWLVYNDALQQKG